MSIFNRHIILPGILPLFLLSAGCAQEVQKSIVILHDNDVHCAAEGYVPFAGYRDAVVAADTAYVATVSSGDYLQGGSYGSVSRGRYIIDLMNAVGYDVVTLGNHEFDYGFERMQELLGDLKSEVVDLNLTLPGSAEPIFAPYTIRTFGKTRIAFVGATTPGTVVSEAYSFFDKQGNPLLELHESDFLQHLQASVDKARGEGADYVIFLSHLGEVPINSPVNSTDIIPLTHGIDAVLEGHTHNLIEEEWLSDADGKQVLLTQTGTAFNYIGQLTITPDGKLHAACHPRADMEKYCSARVDSVLKGIDNDLSEMMEAEIIHTGFPLLSYDSEGNRFVRYQETNLGDLTTDAVCALSGAQIGFVNGGGIRADIKEGSVRYVDVNNVHPFSNAIVLMEMTGQQIIDLLEWTSQQTPEADGNFLQVSGLRYTIDTRIKNKLSVDDSNRLKVDGKRRVKVEIRNASGKWVAIHPKDVFTVATNSYVADTGKSFPTMIPVKHLQDEVSTDLDCLSQFLHLLGDEIPEEYRNPDGQGRIRIIK